jgi:hypothetical protein
MSQNLKVVLDKFSTLSYAVCVMNVIIWRRQERSHLELKTWPKQLLDSFLLAIMLSTLIESKSGVLCVLLHDIDKDA